MWSTGEGNGKPLQYSCLKNLMNSMKRQKDRTLKDELPRSEGATYVTGEQWRNNSRKNEEMEPKQKQHPVVDVTALTYMWGFPGGASGKEPTCQCRRTKRGRFDSWMGKIPGEENGNPLQYSCLENPTDRGALEVTVHGVTELDMTYQLSPHRFRFSKYGVRPGNLYTEKAT